MLCCRRKNSSSRLLHAIWDTLTTYTKNWMPNGFLPKTVVWISAEAVGAITAEALTPPLLNAANNVAENYIPLYRQIPLITACAIPLIFASKNQGIVTVVVTSALLTVYSWNDLSEIASYVAGFCIYNVGTLFASIAGGYAGLALTHSSEVFSEYRFKMVEHSFAGRAFEICIAPANVSILKIPRLLLRILCQTVAYNRQSIGKVLKASVREKKTYGVIGPTLTRALYSRFQAIDTKSLAKAFCEKLFPFLTNSQSLFLSTCFVQPIVNTQLEQSQERINQLLIILTRSLIEYNSLIERNGPLTQQELLAIISQYTTVSRPFKWVGNKVLWNEANVASLTEFLCRQIQTMETELMGRLIYPTDHYQFIESTIKLHLKPFILFAHSRGINPDLAQDPLTEMEDIQLIAILHRIVFNTFIHPLLPKCITKAASATSKLFFTAVIGSIHKLQGVPTQTMISSPPALIGDYSPEQDLTEEPQRQQAPKIVEDHFSGKDPTESDSDYVMI